ncbi:MAG: dihydropteroate synthase [Winkia neuii]|nr:dihydropteroate synthase [Winkia neuii]MDK8099374.1 dihydropteroate synthase [Winkia neuii]MDU3134486.1 dihydropteroate synthase [Winkia neuii]
MSSSSMKTLLMAVCNVTPDSFSDGGDHQRPQEAIEYAKNAVRVGADLIDVGGESTRPGSTRISPTEEIRRVGQVVQELVSSGITVSVDTIHAATAEYVLDLGAQIINDISGGAYDPDMVSVIADSDCDYILQHMRGTPDTMDQLASYPEGVVPTVIDELRLNTDKFIRAGVSPSRIIWDPGLGFAKTPAQSWSLLGATAELASASPCGKVLIGTSRKRFLESAVPAGTQAPANRGNIKAHERDLVTAATSALASASGAWGVRVHDVARTRAALDLMSELEGKQ